MPAERELLKSKIHRATVTEADVNYIGSISIDEDLMDRVDLWSGEKVAVWSVSTRERIETYAIPAPRGSGQIKLNGGAAHRFSPGDLVVIAAFCRSTVPIEPHMILVDENNRFSAAIHLPQIARASARSGVDQQEGPADEQGRGCKSSGVAGRPAGKYACFDPAQRSLHDNLRTAESMRQPQTDSK
jgi:aspartate 1-decarboxylase